jgi:hypothetical protein
MPPAPGLPPAALTLPPLAAAPLLALVLSLAPTPALASLLLVSGTASNDVVTSPHAASTSPEPIAKMAHLEDVLRCPKTLLRGHWIPPFAASWNDENDAPPHARWIRQAPAQVANGRSHRRPQSEAGTVGAGRASGVALEQPAEEGDVFVADRLADLLDRARRRHPSATLKLSARGGLRWRRNSSMVRRMTTLEAKPGLVELLFGLRAPVSRRAYAAVGFGLMVLKYAVDAGFVYAMTGKVWTPWQYLSPVITLREQGLGDRPAWMYVVMALWTLPFLWIGMSMSIRRAVHAGVSPWLGLLFVVPVLNYLGMVALCTLPGRPGPDDAPRSLYPYRAAPPAKAEAVVLRAELTSALAGIGVGLALAACMAVLTIYAVNLYGAALFFGTPLVMGVASAYIFNRRARQGVGATLGVAALTLTIAMSALLLFALEGVVCLAMASPIIYGLGTLGALIGRAVAVSGHARLLHSFVVMLALPILAGFESRVVGEPPVYEVVSVTEIDAPPDVVWPNVIGFSELDPPSELVFRLGIAYPVRAVIEGEGVGAVRRCEFSTGPFVEPITTWEAPRRLSFDVASQPEPMHEWSPYRNVTPPHLDGTIRSIRGEFRLIPLDGGRRTRLEGSTWYQLSMHPRWYWTVWSDRLIHSVHERVLVHIKRLSEAPR